MRSSTKKKVDRSRAPRPRPRRPRRPAASASAALASTASAKRAARPGGASALANSVRASSSRRGRGMTHATVDDAHRRRERRPDALGDAHRARVRAAARAARVVAQLNRVPRWADEEPGRAQRGERGLAVLGARAEVAVDDVEHVLRVTVRHERSGRQVLRRPGQRLGGCWRSGRARERGLARVEVRRRGAWWCEGHCRWQDDQQEADWSCASVLLLWRALRDVRDTGYGGTTDPGSDS